jgi:hypothetical protein
VETHPQALTYGVLIGTETRRFTVRWALKTTKPQTDFEWYTYTTEEIEHWRSQLIGIAKEIREWRTTSGVWRTNFSNCYRYGTAYACPFVGDCPLRATLGEPRTPHSDLEALIANGEFPGHVPPNPERVVVLSSSRVGDYLECPEKYRRMWEAGGHGFGESQNDNLTIGSDFHLTVSEHLATMIKPKEIK